MNRQGLATVSGCIFDHDQHIASVKFTQEKRGLFSVIPFHHIVQVCLSGRSISSSEESIFLGVFCMHLYRQEMEERLGG